MPQAEASLATRLNDMQSLHEFSKRLLQEDDVNVVLHNVLAAVLRLFNAKRGSVQMLDKSRQRLQLVSAIGFDGEFCDKLQLVEASGLTPSAVAFNRRERVVVEDLARDPAFAQFAKTAAEYGVLARPNQRRFWTRAARRWPC